MASSRHSVFSGRSPLITPASGAGLTAPPAVKALVVTFCLGILHGATGAPYAGPPGYDAASSGHSRPTVGLALSGGGARGLAHIGVLMALEEEGIPVDAISGVSMGAVIGGLYAAGVPVDSLVEIAHLRAFVQSPKPYENRTAYQKAMERPRAFTLFLSGWEYRLPIAVIDDLNINWLFIRSAGPGNLHAAGDFDRLPVPFSTLALDLVSGEICELRQGDLARAIRSSMSVPVAYPPIPMDNPERLFIDPGSIQNMPIEQVRSMGCDIVIAVNCASRWEDRRVSETADRVAMELLRILSQRVDSLLVPGWDVWIEPDLGDVGMTSFESADFFIKAGYRAARDRMDGIRALFPEGSLPSPRSAASRHEILETLGDLSVAYVRLEGRVGSYNWVPRRDLGLSPGDRFTFAALEQGMRRLHATGNYESIWPRLELAAPGEVGIVLELRERAPAQVSIGLLYDNSRKANIDVEFRRDNLLRLGETLYTSLHLGNFFGGLEAGMRSSQIRGVPVGFDLLLRADRTLHQQQDRGNFIRNRRLAQLSASFIAGRQVLGLVGVRLDRGEGKGWWIPPDRRGADDEETCGWNQLSRTLYSRFYLDSTDDAVLPGSGWRLDLEYGLVLEDLEDPVLQTASGRLLHSRSFGPLTFRPEVRAAGLSREGMHCRHWHRLDLSRATLGWFEMGLYAPCVAGASMTASVPLAGNLHFWAGGTAGVRGERFKDLADMRSGRGCDVGFLQQTPAGPVQAGVSFEEGRRAVLFIQLGHDLSGVR